MRSGNTKKAGFFLQRGRIFPVALSGVILSGMIMLMIGNLGNRITEKSITVSAADAASYSGATWVAQHLNFMAYTNRAMIANHVGVGHCLSPSAG